MILILTNLRVILGLLGVILGLGVRLENFFGSSHISPKQSMYEADKGRFKKKLVEFSTKGLTPPLLSGKKFY